MKFVLGVITGLILYDGFLIALGYRGGDLQRGKKMRLAIECLVKDLAKDVKVDMNEGIPGQKSEVSERFDDPISLFTRERGLNQEASRDNVE